MKKINQYKRTYYKEQGALLGLVLVFIIFIFPAMYQNGHISYQREEVATTTIAVAPTIEDKIKQYFPKSYPTMIAVAKAETGGTLSMDAKGYNCFYYHGVATTTPIKKGSKACKVKDRALAWSVDCFVLQKNYKGKVCPSGVTLDQHLQEVAELSKVQGLEAWSSFNSGKHLKYLTQN